MGLNLYNLTLNAYSAFLESSGLLGNRISAACISFSDNSKDEALKEAESKGLINKQNLTDEGKIIANIICLPEKTIVATNSTFGPVPLCIFSFKDGFWSLVKLDNINKNVMLLAPIEQTDILSIVKDALVGEHNVSNFTQYSLTLNNDEIIILNTLIMLLGMRLKEKNGPLMSHNYRFNLDDLFLNKEFAKIALVGEIAGKSSEIIDFIKDSERIKIAINGLINKHVITKSTILDYYEPSLSFFNFLCPQNNMFILSYSDISNKKGHKYYVFPNSILEITVDRNSITFTSVNEFDFSVWN